MALITCRALQKGCLNFTLRPCVLNPRLGKDLGLPLIACVKSSTVAKGKDEMHSFWVKNETFQRPKSPHLTIWRWELPMNLSLAHRVTGCALTTALYVFGYGIFILPGDYVTYLNMIKDLSLGPALITSAKFVLAFPLIYHCLNGVRHLSWDAGKGMSLRSIYATGWSVLAISILLSAAATQL